MKFQAPKGTKDVLPYEMDQWLKVEETVREVMRRFNYREIRTPSFEDTALFTRGVGEATDMVQKEMYIFEDRGHRSLTLLPEGTAPVVRAYLEHEMGKESPHIKLFYIARMFRQENPQKGRLRQHTQFGAEAIGSYDPLQDAEIIQVALSIYEALGIYDRKEKRESSTSQLLLNSVGCSKCRPLYKKALRTDIGYRLKRLCPDCHRRFETNPLRILDCKVESCMREMEGVTKVSEFLCGDCLSHMERLKGYLQDLELDYVLAPRLVRGLDYYTRTTFEFVSSKLGGQDAIGGGGRYDSLIEELGGESTPAVGFASGIERLLLVMPDSVAQASLPVKGIDFFIAAIGEDAVSKGFTLLNQLRKKGFTCDMDFLGRSLKSQMRIADKLGSRNVYIIGDEELKKGRGILRKMETHEQEEVGFEEIMRKFSKENL